MSIVISGYDQAEWLGVLTNAHSGSVVNLAEVVLEELGEVTVLVNRTGLMMQPYRDSREGGLFHLGEVLVAEAHIQLSSGTEGYGMVLGRDTLFAMAVAVIDAALQDKVMVPEIAAFLDAERASQAAADETLLRQVEATRVEMQTF